MAIRIAPRNGHQQDRPSP